MTGDEKQQLKKILHYWYLQDMVEQSKCPDARGRYDIFPRDSKTIQSISQRFKVDCSRGDVSFLEDIKKKINASNKSTYGIKKAVKCDEDTPLFDCLCDTFIMPAIYIHVGVIPRDLVVKCLAGKRDKRQERDVDAISIALIKLDGGGCYRSIELSPAIWALANSNGDVPDIEVFNGASKRMNEQLEVRFGTNALTYEDVRGIINPDADTAFAASLKRLSGTYDKEGNVDFKKDCSTLIVDYRFVKKGDSNREYADYEVKLANSFFAKDILAFSEEIDKGASIAELKEGPLRLAFDYLEGGFEKNLARDAKRIDIMSKETNDQYLLRFYREKLSLNTLPLGRWPSKYHLSLMQQVAVNVAVGRKRIGEQFPANDIVSVNGPPGTGKTTLLKDVVAANIVEKARLLAEYGNPDDAFEESVDLRGYLKFASKVYRFKKKGISDLGVLVCSTNNAAVENIAKELPSGRALFDGLDERLGEPDIFKGNGETSARELFVCEPFEYKKKEDRKNEKVPDTYFSFAADIQFDEGTDSCDVDSLVNPGMLLTARLGKRDNVAAFRRALDMIPLSNRHRAEHKKKYAEARDRFSKQYERVAREQMAHACEEEKACVAEANFQSACAERARIADKALKKQGELDACRDACEAFLLHEVASIQESSREMGYFENVSSRDDLLRLGDELSAQTIEYELELKHKEDDFAAAQKREDETHGLLSFFVEKKRAEQTRAAKDTLEIFKKRNLRNGRLVALRLKLEDALGRIDGQRAHVARLNQELEALREEERKRRDEIARMEREIEDANSHRPNRVTAETIEGILGTDDDMAKKVHLTNPAIDFDTPDGGLRIERDKLLLYALQLTREFILSSKCMADNFIFLRALWGKPETSAESEGDAGRSVIRFSEADRRKMAPALFESLNVLTPVISSTFASVARLFGDIPIGSEAPFGLLVIDEAGQAVPYAALGALSRSRRALVVGDPRQIEPVVTSETKLLRDALLDRASNTELEPFVRGSASVQGFADRANPYGHYHGLDCMTDDGNWIGCPLIVHRRCISPMFDISNEISYEGGMLNQAKALEESSSKDKSKLNAFSYPSSQWFNVVGSEKGKKDHYVDEQGRLVYEIVSEAFARRQCGTGLPSLYVIAPFKTIVAGVRSILRKMREEDKASYRVPNEDWNEFVAGHIGTVHAFQGKEADEVIFVLGCDRKTGDGAIQFVSPNIVNVAASRAKYRLYVIGDYFAWDSNENIRTMKRILDTAWVPHWEAYQQSVERGEPDIAELRAAKVMLPLGSSLPQVDDVGNKAGEEGTSLSAESYLDNIHSSFSGALQISDEDCVPFGFDSKKTLEESYRDCIGDNGENRVVQCIEQGILLYKMALAMERYKHNVGDCSYGDYSFCEIMFCRAVDLYLQKKLLPLLKKLVPNAHIGQKPLSSMDSLTLGMYPRLFNAKVGHTGKKFTEAFTCCCAGDESKVLQSDAPLSELWWKRLRTTIENYSRSRNSAAHAGRGEINDFEHLARSLVYLFEGYVWEAEKNDKRVPILSQGNAFKMAESGLKNASDNGVGTHHVHEKCEPRKCCDGHVAAPRPSLDGPGASLEQASLSTVAPIWVEKRSLRFFPNGFLSGRKAVGSSEGLRVLKLSTVC